ncbi:hypothetical protein PHAVU_002G059700 [Phaseolus vulgaris]|uniref:Uncharacterized protein n=1 Tax=Phaseolus vulgaris TaxID=3885 RepID=V7CGR1_PHAVU|nr:hypothetical protein PHAVU_002G059700g [Phaseolus vulgaris]ESW29309.1 hypothetical protein PHAVU_002G059700g [Phaseolus vulgaris]
MNVRMKRELTSLMKAPIERGWCNGLRCFSSVSSRWKGDIPTLLQPRVLLYDALSLFCHQGVKWVIRADKDIQIKFCSCGLDREDVLHRMLFVEGLNEYSQGSTAALRVLSYLPPPYSALSSLWVIPTPLRDIVYDFAAKQRYEWLGRAKGYLVLREKDLLERFIDREELMRRAQDL